MLIEQPDPTSRDVQVEKLVITLTCVRNEGGACLTSFMLRCLSVV